MAFRRTTKCGKVMSIKDELIPEYFLLATKIDMPSEKDPMLLKKALALQIVTELHSDKAAAAAQEYFESTFQKGQVPENIMPSISPSVNILDQLVDNNLVSSRSEGRRIIDQGGVTVNGQKVKNINETVNSEAIIKVGSRKFIKTK